MFILVNAALSVLKCKCINDFVKAHWILLLLSKLTALLSWQSFIFDLKCVLTSFKQLEDLSDYTDATGIGQKCNLKKSAYLTKVTIALGNKIADFIQLWDILAKYWHITMSRSAFNYSLHMFHFADIWIVLWRNQVGPRQSAAFRSLRQSHSRWINLSPANGQHGPIMW